MATSKAKRKVKTATGNMFRHFQAASQTVLTAPLAITSTIVDRKEGTAEVSAIWRDTVNIDYIARTCGRSARVRSEVAKFFSSHALAQILPKLMPVRTINVGTTVAMRTDLIQKAISSYLVNQAAASVVTEIVIAYLAKLNLVTTTSSNFVTRVYHTKHVVTVSHLALDIAMEEVARAVTMTKPLKIDDRVYTPDTLSQDIASALAPVGRVFLRIASITTVLDDIVAGVRANIDPEMLGLTGHVPAEWRDHPVVQEFSSNLVFVQAACALPAQTSVTPVNSDFRREQYAPEIASQLRTSTRYAIVGRNRVADHFSLTKIRDIRGVVHAAVLTQNAAFIPFAQSIYIFNDARVAGNKIIQQASERVAQAFVSASPAAANFSLTTVAKSMSEILRNVCEITGTLPQRLYSTVVDVPGTMSVTAAAALLSNQVRFGLRSHPDFAIAMSDRFGFKYDPYADTLALDVNVDTDASDRDSDLADTDLLQPGSNAYILYEVATREIDCGPFFEGQLVGDRGFTDVPDEVFTLVEDFTASTNVPPVAQDIPGSAQGSSFMGFDPETTLDAVHITKRFAYSFTVAGKHIHGVARAIDMNRLSADTASFLTVPRYNKSVVSAWMNLVLTTVRSLVEAKGFNSTLLGLATDTVTNEDGSVSLPYDASRYVIRPLPDNSAQLLAIAALRSLMHLSRAVDEGFRNEFQSIVSANTLSRMAPADVMELRGTMLGQAFIAAVDLEALLFLLSSQGLVDKEVIEEIRNSEFIDQLLLEGSDRKARLA